MCFSQFFIAVKNICEKLFKRKKDLFWGMVSAHGHLTPEHHVSELVASKAAYLMVHVMGTSH
jgi:hypothetical protein